MFDIQVSAQIFSFY